MLQASWLKTRNSFLLKSVNALIVFTFTMVHGCCGGIALAQVSQGKFDVIPTQNVSDNLFINSEFEANNKQGVTDASSIATRGTSSPVNAKAPGYMGIDATTSGQIVKFAMRAVDGKTVALKGGNCQAVFAYTGDATLYKAYILQGSTKVSVEETLLNASTTPSSPQSLSWPCVVGTTYDLAIESTGNGAAIKVDSLIGGACFSCSQVSQASIVAAGYIASTASCSWSRASTSLGAFGTTSACGGVTVEGNSGPGSLQTTDTDLPQFTVNNLPAGDYIVFITGGILTSSTSTTRTLSLAVNDGTTTSGATTYITDNTTARSGLTLGIIGYFSYSGSPTNRTFAVYGSASGDSVSISNNSTTDPSTRINFRIFRAPSSAQTVTSYNNMANLIGVPFPWIESSQCPSGSVRMDGSTLSGSQYSALIALKGTSVMKNLNALGLRGIGTQTVNGRTKTGPTNPGDVQEDQMQGHRHDRNVNGTAEVARISTGGGSIDYTGGAGLSGTFQTTSVPVTDTVNGTPRTGLETQGNSMGVIWCQWYVSQPAMMITQSVITSNISGVTMVGGATIKCDGSSAIDRQIGDWVSSVSNAVDNGANRSCAITLNGKFSSSPMCNVTINSLAGAGAANAAQVSVTNSNAIVIYGPDANYYADVLCMGPR